MANKTDRYILLFGGIISLIFGILLFTQTTATLGVIILLVGLTWFIQGLVTMASIFIDRTEWGWKLFIGALGLAAGMFVIQNPVASTVVIPAIYAIIMGLFGLLIGFAALVSAFQGEGWGLGVFGALSLVIGLVLMFNSIVGGAALVWVTALLLVIQGGIGIFSSFSNG